MPDGYLDEPYEEKKQSGYSRNFDFRQLKLLELADNLPDDEVDKIIKLMEEKSKFYEQQVKEYLIKLGIDPTKIELKKLK